MDSLRVLQCSTSAQYQYHLRKQLEFPLQCRSNFLKPRISHSFRNLGFLNRRILCGVSSVLTRYLMIVWFPRNWLQDKKLKECEMCYELKICSRYLSFGLVAEKVRKKREKNEFECSKLVFLFFLVPCNWKFLISSFFPTFS